MKKRRSILSNIVLAIILLCLGISIIGVLYFGLDYMKAKKEYEELRAYITELSTEDTLQYYVDWESLYQINPDIIGWIVIPGTNIDYPIVQCEDNSTYLNRTFSGEKNKCGAIFTDCENRADFGDLNTIIYGHNMKDGSMFRPLNEYRDKAFYDEHQEVWILTPFWQRKYCIISAHLAQATSDTFSIAFADQDAYVRHIGREVEQSFYDTGRGYNVSLPMVTLSTCNGVRSSKRMVLVCQPIYEIKIAD